jgi:Porin subfamily
MKLFKSLLLASATGLVAVSGASAADLGAKKPSPVEYVKACYNPLWGTAGGFVIPGTQTCLRISGRVRADYIYNETLNATTGVSAVTGLATGFTNGRTLDAFGWRVRAILNADAITQTSIGAVRSFYSIFFQGDRGNIAGGNFASFAGNNSFTNVSVDKAFIQFAGITAGRAQSFFDFAPNFSPSYNFTVGLGEDAGTTNLLAYTAVLGNGVSATVSLEEPSSFRATGAAAFLAPGAVNYARGGVRMPDVVASIDVNQAWGQFKLAGVVSQIRTATNLNPLGTAFVGTTYGFAIMAGVKVNLPQLSAGSFVWLQGSYADGAINRVGGFAAHGNLPLTTADAYVTALGGTAKAKAWSIDAGFNYQFTAATRGWIVATYRQFDAPNSVMPAVLAGGVRIGLVDFSNLRIGAGVQHTLAPGLVVGAEVNYLMSDPSGRVAAPRFGRTASSASAWEGRLRIQRDF